MRTLRHREFKRFAKGHLAIKCWIDIYQCVKYNAYHIVGAYKYLKHNKWI